MRFAFSEDQAAIHDAVDSFLTSISTSGGTRLAMDDGTGLDRPLWHAMASELGLTGTIIPESFGGSELGAVETAIICEALGYQVAAVPWLASAVIATHAIARGGSDAQRSEWLPRLAEGNAILSFADKGFSCQNGLVSGTSRFVPQGCSAEAIIVHADNRVYLVPTETEYCLISPQTSLDQTRPLAKLTLDHAKAELLAAVGWDEIEPLAWTAIAADALGGAQACLDQSVAYVGERVQFGRAIGSFQAVKHKLADMLIGLEQARSAVYWAAGEIDSDGGDARFASHAAKSFACDTYAECAGQAIQLLGGIGFTWEHDAHLYFKRARANLAMMGAPSWHREQIAKLILPEDLCA